MSKRSLEEVEATNSVTESKKDGPVKKKSKKDKVVASTDAPEPTTTENTEEESKEARKARKALKKAKKLAEENQKKETTSETPVTTAEDDAAAKKAAKKAAKAAKKESKTVEKSQATSVVEEPTESETTAIPNSGNYTQSAELSALPQSEIDAFLADKFISITDPLSTKPTLRPITQFSYLPKTQLKGADPFKDFKEPSPIQAASWPFLLAGRDVVGVAETGSGKTMAFAVPCVRAIAALPKSKQFKGAKAVVVSPTRELAMQSYEQIMKLCSASGLEVVCVYGGVPKHEQRKALATADIVVATPGRLKDLMEEGSADLSRCCYVVLDEADRMLDKGFEDDIRKIISTTLPLGQRQTLMFTATWPESVRTLASTFMTSPIKIAIGDNPTGDLRANARIVQKVEVIEPRDKEYRLLQLLKQYQSGAQKDDRILVFCLYKKEATRIENFIRQKGFRVAGIHGDLTQEQRTRSLEAFKSGGTPILVATDVAARGLDIPAVKLVINVTMGLVASDYIHRIGRYIAPLYLRTRSC